jgi:hypothetical protein
MDAAVASARKRRRIQPIPVPDDEVVPAQLPPATVVTESATKEIPAPSPGRRMWASLDDTFDFSYKKLLADRGIKMAGSCKRNKQASQQFGDGLELLDGLKADRGVQGSKPTDHAGAKTLKVALHNANYNPLGRG